MSSSAPNTSEVHLMREENAVFRTRIEWLKQQLFGSGKSEALDRSQLLLQLGEREKLAASADRPVATITYERPAGPAAGRTLLAEAFAYVPVKETVKIVPEPAQCAPVSTKRSAKSAPSEVM